MKKLHTAALVLGLAGFALSPATSAFTQERHDEQRDQRDIMIARNTISVRKMVQNCANTTIESIMSTCITDRNTSRAAICRATGGNASTRYLKRSSANCLHLLGDTSLVTWTVMLSSTTPGL